MKTQICDPTILNLQILADIYGDESSETIVAALSGFYQAAKPYITALQQSFLEQDLSALSTVAHSLNGICGLTGVIRLATLCRQLEQAAKAKQKSVVSNLMAELTVHWPVLEKQLNFVLKQYGGADAEGIIC
ncbi:hypothetical protein BI198_08880 [Rheinheimera salexigens]|uniref:HPt domain-containing protein n=1 Tax=Rheinheimera salexigens TaxID=1628148 RepID=A0A1E7QAJ0_9GAMM|nr:hypothetical protein BI198_08880 [Rheinheimera salexigens]